MRFLDKHTARDKLLLRLERESKQLQHALNDAPMLPLDEPYQRGWIKFYALREDVRLRHDVELYREVLAKINQRIWARSRDFIGPDKKPLDLRPGIILMHEWQRLNWTPTQRRLFAYGPWKVETGFEATPHRHFYRRSGHLVGFSILNPWWMEEMIEPWMITHRKANLPEVEQRLSEINSYLTHTCGRQRLSNLHGQRDRWSFPSFRELRRKTASVQTTDE